MEQTLKLLLLLLANVAAGCQTGQLLQLVSHYGP